MTARIARIAPALLALTLLAAACSGGKEPVAQPTGSEAGSCSPVEFPEIGSRDHVQPPADVTYDTDPPTSGEHYPNWAETGVYDEPIPDEIQVHNLEHGHVLVQYAGLDDEQVAALEQVRHDDPRMVVLAPRPGMEAAVAMTAWGTLRTCASFDETTPDVVRAFIVAYRDNAPESIP